VGAAAVAAVAALIVGAFYYRDRLLRLAPVTVLKPTAATAQKKPEADIYFADAEYTALVAEKTPLAPAATAEDRIRLLVGALIAGPKAADHSPTLPTDCALESVFIRDRVAVLNFNDKLKSRRFGSTGELYALNSVYRTVTANVPGVLGVVVLVDGRRYQTLAGDGGHVAEGFPLYGELGRYLAPAPKAPTP
jgi:spore germination protein GerM